MGFSESDRITECTTNGTKIGGFIFEKVKIAISPSINLPVDMYFAIAASYSRRDDDRALM